MIKMKSMKKTIFVLFLFFIFIFNKTVDAQSESVYIHDFYITESDNLTTLERTQIDKAVGNIKEYLKAILKGNYDILPEQTSSMLSTDLRGVEVSYRSDADYMIFGTTVYDKDDEYLIVSTYLYEIQAADYLKRKSMHTADGTISMWNTRDSRLEKIDEIIMNIFPNVKKNKLDEERARIEEEKEAERIRQKEKKQKDRERKEAEEREREAERIERERKERERKEAEEREREAKRIEQERIKQEKRENRRGSMPAAGAMTAGAVMGGVGIYWRLQALGLYDEYEIDVDANLETTILDDELETARKPNRRAHIIGAGGILVGSIGVYMWVNHKKKKKSKRKATGSQRINIEPHIEYNMGANTNTVHAKMTYTF